MRELIHGNDSVKDWDAAQELREIAPVLTSAVERIETAAVFPIIKPTTLRAKLLGLKREMKRGMSPKDFAFAELRELFAEPNQATALERANSLKVLVELIIPTATLIERDACTKWYVGGRERFARAVPNAPALYLALAGSVSVSILTGRRNWDFITEVDAHFVTTATAEDINAAEKSVCDTLLALKDSPQ